MSFSRILPSDAPRLDVRTGYGRWVGRPESAGRLELLFVFNGGGTWVASLLSWPSGAAIDRLSGGGRRDGAIVSFCRRLRKASMPSLSSFFGGGGGGGIGSAFLNPGLGRDGSPPLRFEKVEVRDAVEASDVL